MTWPQRVQQSRALVLEDAVALADLVHGDGDAILAYRCIFALRATVLNTLAWSGGVHTRSANIGFMRLNSLSASQAKMLVAAR